MTPAKVKQAVDECERIVLQTVPADETPKRMTGANLRPDQRKRHLLFMCGEIRGFVDEGRIEKAMRWLGFLQGVMWADRIATLDELKDMNRPDSGADES